MPKVEYFHPEIAEKLNSNTSKERSLVGKNEIVSPTASWLDERSNIGIIAKTQKAVISALKTLPKYIKKNYLTEAGEDCDKEAMAITEAPAAYVSLLNEIMIFKKVLALQNRQAASISLQMYEDYVSGKLAKKKEDKKYAALFSEGFVKLKSYNEKITKMLGSMEEDTRSYYELVNGVIAALDGKNPMAKMVTRGMFINVPDAERWILKSGFRSSIKSEKELKSFIGRLAESAERGDLNETLRRLKAIVSASMNEWSKLKMIFIASSNMMIDIIKRMNGIAFVPPAYESRLFDLIERMQSSNEKTRKSATEELGILIKNSISGMLRDARLTFDISLQMILSNLQRKVLMRNSLKKGLKYCEMQLNNLDQELKKSLIVSERTIKELKPVLAKA